MEEANEVPEDVRESALEKARKTIADELINRCSYYFLLEEVCSSQAFAEAKFTTATMDLTGNLTDSDEELLQQSNSEIDSRSATSSFTANTSVDSKAYIESVGNQNKTLATPTSVRVNDQETPTTTNVRKKLEGKLSLNEITQTMKKSRKNKDGDDFIESMSLRQNSIESRRLEPEEQKYIDSKSKEKSHGLVELKKIELEGKKLDAEQKRLDEQLNVDQKRVAVEEGRLDIERQKAELLFNSESRKERLEKIKQNMEIMEMRKKTKEDNPLITDELLDEIMPFEKFSK